MGDKKEPDDGKSRLEEIKYYTSMFLGALCIVCVFAFLFLVPFVLDPAISTLMHQFVEKPVHCRVSSNFSPFYQNIPFPLKCMKYFGNIALEFIFPRYNLTKSTN